MMKPKNTGTEKGWKKEKKTHNAQDQGKQNIDGQVLYVLQMLDRLESEDNPFLHMDRLEGSDDVSSDPPSPTQPQLTSKEPSASQCACKAHT